MMYYLSDGEAELDTHYVGLAQHWKPLKLRAELRASSWKVVICRQRRQDCKAGQLGELECHIARPQP